MTSVVIISANETKWIGGDYEIGRSVRRCVCVCVCLSVMVPTVRGSQGKTGGNQKKSGNFTFQSQGKLRGSGKVREKYQSAKVDKDAEKNRTFAPALHTAVLSFFCSLCLQIICTFTFKFVFLLLFLVWLQAIQKIDILHEQISQGRLFILSYKVRENEFCRVVGTMVCQCTWIGGDICTLNERLLVYLIVGATQIWNGGGRVEGRAWGGIFLQKYCVFVQNFNLFWDASSQEWGFPPTPFLQSTTGSKLRCSKIEYLNDLLQ